VENLVFLQKNRFLGFLGKLQDPRTIILYTILHVTSFLLSEWRDVNAQKSRLKYESKCDVYYKLHNKIKIT